MPSRHVKPKEPPRHPRSPCLGLLRVCRPLSSQGVNRPTPIAGAGDSSASLPFQGHGKLGAWVWKTKLMMVQNTAIVNSPKMSPKKAGRALR